MVEIGSQKMQNVASQDRRSAGSTQFPSGRFPKVSIGIPFDHKNGSKKDTAVLPSVRQTSSCQGDQRTTKTEHAETLKRNQPEAVGQQAAWFSTKYVHLETPAAETVQFYVNRASVLHSEDGMHKTENTVAYGKRRQKGGDVQRVEEIAYASVQKTQFLDKGIGGEESEKIARRGTEGLKLKLWEILGTAPYQNRHSLNPSVLEENKEDIDKERDLVKPKGKVATSNMIQPNPQENRGNTNTDGSRGNQKSKIVRSKSTSTNFEDNKENININISKKHQKGKVTRTKQDSDTIENDSGSGNQVSRRPITRSSTRKKVPPNTANKIQGNSDYGKKPLSSSSSGFKLKREKNIFAFDEGEGIAGTLNRTASGHSSRSKEKITDRKKAILEPRKIYFDRSASDNSLQCHHKEQMSLSPDKNSPYCMEKVASPLPSQRTKQVMQKGDSHNSQKDVENHLSTPKFSYHTAPFRNADSPLFKRKKFSWDNDISPPLPGNDVLHKKDASPSMSSEPEPFDDLQRPTFAMNMCPTSKALLPNEVLCSTEPSKLAREVQGLKDADKSSPGSSQSDTNTESTLPQDATLGTHKSQDTESLHTKDESEKPLSLSLNDQNTESEADDCKGRDSEVHDEVPNSKTSKHSPFSLHLTRRSCNLNKLRKSELSSMSPLGTEETIGSLDVSEQLPEDSLARSIAQLAMVLQRFRAGLKARTRKRSSEVLSEAADKIRLQLQDAESRILADVGKFSSASKSKRKRLESEFQEQQERLTVMHNKYKEEVNLHLMDCRRTLEKLEACHVELKGTADRQKASHRKLLLQVEEVMKAQISDAETIIDAIHKEARKKMSGLKCVLREFV